VDQRREKIVLETDRYRIEGEMTLPSTGYRSRLSDHVNRREIDFFTVQSAVITPLDGDGGQSWTTPVLMVANRHVRLIAPAGEQDDA